MNYLEAHVLNISNRLLCYALNQMYVFISI